MTDPAPIAPMVPQTPAKSPGGPVRTGGAHDRSVGADIFLKLGARIGWNTWKSFSAVSLVRPLVILVCSLIVVLFVFAVSFGGFRFLVDQKLPLGGNIVALLFDLLFLSLAGLLVFSTGLILHASLFDSAETAFLLSKPVDEDQVFAYKFFVAGSFSSWAFLLMGGPILVAYSISVGAGPLFYLIMPLFFIGFSLIPASVGAILCLLMVNFLPRGRTLIVALGVILPIVIGGLWIGGTLRGLRQGDIQMGEDLLQKTLGQVQIASAPVLPSYWISRGLRAAAFGDYSSSGWYLTLVWSHGAFVYLLAATLARLTYRRGVDRLSINPETAPSKKPAWIDLLFQWFSPRDRGLAALMLKDFRTFRRDPRQWGQVVLFLGLLALYFSNLKRMFPKEIEYPFQVGLGFLNLLSLSLLMCTYTGRFVFPQLSLEGRRFWVLGLMPIERRRMLMAKYWFAFYGSLLVTLPLIVLSDLSLSLPLFGMVLHLYLLILISSGLSALSVGLGTLMPNFRETDPSKIAVGFGGTLNLIVGLAFLLFMLGFGAMPWHMSQAVAGIDGPPRGVWYVVGGGLLLATILGALATFLALDRGRRALDRMEF